MKTSLIIVAGGFSTRMGGNVKKPYLCINDKPVFLHTLETYCKVSDINQIIFVVNSSDLQMVKEKWGEELGKLKVSHIIAGGERRQDSVFNGLMCADKTSDVILIHDCVRPFITTDIIRKVINDADECGAAIVAVPVKDTIKETKSDNNLRIRRTVPRSNLWAAQTPQGFKSRLILDAYNMINEKAMDITDDAQAVELFGHDVKIVEGSYKNIKITTQEDLSIAEVFLNSVD